MYERYYDKCYFYVTGALLTLTILVFTVGGFIDEFQFKINSKMDFEGEPVYPGGLEFSNKMFKWFFSIPVLFIFIYMIWMVKVSVEKARYTRQEQNYYDKF